jgi:hypothetical protein
LSGSEPICCNLDAARAKVVACYPPYNGKLGSTSGENVPVATAEADATARSGGRTVSDTVSVKEQPAAGF